jgi:uncharacterized membrane protein (DUF373 family)
MRHGPLADAFKKFEAASVIVLKVLLIMSVAIAIVMLYVLFFSGIRAHLMAIDSVSAVQTALQHVFAGVLLVLLGLELIETLNAYSADHHVRIEVVLIVAMIALGRHIVQMDFEHLSGPVLFGVAALMIALAVSYYAIKRAHHDERPTR